MDVYRVGCWYNSWAQANKNIKTCTDIMCEIQ